MKALRIRNIASMVVLLLFAAILLTGCGNQSGEKTKKTVNQQNNENDTGEDPVPSVLAEDDDSAAEADEDGPENEAEAPEQEKVYTYNTLQVQGLRVTEQSLKGIKLEWDELPDTEYYEVVRSTEGDDSRIAFTTDFNETYYIDEEILPGAIYSYCVRGVSSLEETGLVSKESSSVSAGINLSTPSIEVKKAEKGVTITVGNIGNGQGYCIYMSTSKKGEYKRIQTQNDIQVSTFTYKSLESGKTYYFKARTFYKSGDETCWSGYSNIASYTVKSSKEAAKIPEYDLDTIKSMESLILENCAQYPNDWDPNRDLSIKEYEVTHVSFVPGSNISPLIFIVRSKYIGSKEKGIDKIEGFFVYHDATSNLFSYYNGAYYSLFEGYDPVIKMYKDDKGNQFMLGHFKFDCSGASGQVGNLFDGYYKLSKIENFEGSYYEYQPEHEVAGVYDLNYHSIVGDKKEIDAGYKKAKEAYFKKVKELDYEETKVAYDMDASYEERYKALKKAYEANYKYLK